MVDWHKKLVGVPLVHSVGLAPVFHRVVSSSNERGNETTRSLVISAAESGVLGALDVIDGSVGESCLRIS